MEYLTLHCHLFYKKNKKTPNHHQEPKTTTKNPKIPSNSQTNTPHTHTFQQSFHFFSQLVGVVCAAAVRLQRSFRQSILAKDSICQSGTGRVLFCKHKHFVQVCWFFSGLTQCSVPEIDATACPTGSSSQLLLLAGDNTSPCLSPTQGPCSH